VSIRVRDALPADGDAIASVHVASWRWAYAGIVPDHELDALSVDDRRELWRAWFEIGDARAALLVAEEGARIVGFCGVGRSRDDDATLIVGEVLTLYLLEWAAGRGIGRALFAEAIGRMRALGYERATLWVLRDSARARRFYEAAGWIVDGNASDHAFGDVTLPIVRYACDL